MNSLLLEPEFQSGRCIAAPFLVAQRWNKKWDSV